MKNPDKYLRKGYLTALTNAGLIAYNKDIPPSVTPIPAQYVLIESQTKTTTVRSKTEFEWISRITLHIISINQRGYSATTFVDDAEEKCITAIENGILVDNFYLKSTYQISSINLDLTDKTTTIERRVLMYEHWLSEVGLNSSGPSNPGSIPVIPFTPILIPAGTSIPYFLPVAGETGFDASSEVIVEVLWVDPQTNSTTGKRVRVYDTPTVKQDTNNNGTGTFTGWSIYGHAANNSLTFQEDTYITLR